MNATTINSLRGKEGAAGTAPAKRDEKKDFPAMLEKFKGEIARALPQHINPERMTRIALTAFRQNPGLARCDPRSVFAAVIQSSQLGLEVGLMGEAHLVPFNKRVKRGNDWVDVPECQLIPGYQGLMKLARNSGLVKDIYAHEVRKNDEFEVTLGLNRDLRHKPLMENGFPASDEKRGDVTGFYAVAVFKDGSTSFVALPGSKIIAVRDKSSGYIAAKRNAEKYKKEINSPWVSDFEAMGMKTVIRRLCKMMPKSPELAAAIALDEAIDRGARQGLDINTNVIDGDWSPVMDEDAPEGGETSGDSKPAGEQKVAGASDQSPQRTPGNSPDSEFGAE